MVRSLIGKGWNLRTEIAWVALGQMLAFLGGFAAMKALTSIMGPDGYGYFVLGLTIAGVIQMFVFGPLGQAVTRYLSVFTEHGELSTYLALAVQTHVRAAVLILAFAGAVALVVAQLFGAGWGFLTALASLFAVVQGLNTSGMQFLNAARLRKFSALHQGADVWIRALLGVGGALVSGWFGLAAITGYLAGGLLLFLSVQRAVRRSDILQHQMASITEWSVIDRATRVAFLRYTGSFALGAIPVAVTTFADRWIIQGFIGNREVGIYSALYQIANAPFVLLIGLLNQVSIPLVYERAGALTNAMHRAASRQTVNWIMAFVAALTAAITAIAFLISEWIVPLLTTSEFASHHHLLPVLAGAIGIAWIGHSKCIEAECHRLPHITLLPKFLCAGIFLAGALPMGRSYGVSGVSLALVISSAVYTASVFFVVHKATSEQGKNG